MIHCSKLQINSIIAPPFVVDSGEYIGLAIPCDYGPDWVLLMDYLAGVKSSTSVEISARVASKMPLSTSWGDDLPKVSIIDYLCGMGLSREEVSHVMSSSRLKPELFVDRLQLTPRLSIDIILAVEQGAQVVIFSTAGLDPKGVRQIGSLVHGTLQRCSAVNLFSDALPPDNESTQHYARIIKCLAVEGR